MIEVRPDYGSSQVRSVAELEPGLMLERILPGALGLPAMDMVQITAVGKKYDWKSRSVIDDPDWVQIAPDGKEPTNLRYGNMSLRDTGVLPFVNPDTGRIYGWSVGFLRHPEPPVKVISGGKIDRLDFSQTDVIITHYTRFAS